MKMKSFQKIEKKIQKIYRNTVKPVYNSLGYNENCLLTNVFGRSDVFVINRFNCINYY